MHRDLVDTTEELDHEAKSMLEGANDFSTTSLVLAYRERILILFQLENSIKMDNNMTPVHNGVAHPEVVGPKISNGQVFERIH